MVRLLLTASLKQSTMKSENRKEMRIMKMLKNMKNVNALQAAIANCKDSVVLRSADGREEYNLKSAMSQLVGIARLCEEHGDEYEVFCMNHADEGNLFRFFRELRQNEATVA